MEKRIFFALVVSFFLIPFLSSDFTNSSVYDMSVVISDGGNNASSLVYSQVTVVGEISGNTSSSVYSTRLGFLAGVVGRDLIPPNVTIISPTATTYSSASVSFEVATSESSTCDYSLNAGTSNTTMTANSTNTGFTATATLANAAYTINFYCQDGSLNLNNSEGVSFTVSVSAPATPTGGSSGGGSTSSVSTSESLDFSIEPTMLTETIVLNRIVDKEFTIINNNDAVRIFELELIALGEIIEMDNSSVSLSAYESKQIPFRIHAPFETGVYTGKINLKYREVTKSLNIILNVITEKSLFDITLKIPTLMKTISKGENLNVYINMIQMGLREKMDVTLNYVIKDFEGKVYLAESETIAVLEEASLEKEFFTENLLEGDYVVGVELVYPDGVAVASSHFKVGDNWLLDNFNWMISAIILAMILGFVFFIIKRYKRKGKNYIKKKR